MGECFVKNTQHRLLLWEQKYSSNGSKVAAKSDLTNSSFTQKHTQLKKALYILGEFLFKESVTQKELGIEKVRAVPQQV